jgi:hypothetical protein
VSCVLNQNNGDPNFLSRVLFTDEAMFGRESCFNAHNWDVFHRGFQVYNSSLFNEFVRKLGLFWHEWTILKHE